MKYKILAWLPAVLIMIIIFSFSAKPAVESSESSMVIANSILNAYENISEQLLETDIRMDRLLMIEHIVRKGAHITEYAVLAVSIAFALWVNKIKGNWLVWISVTIAALYAATDELHQRFVPGRSGQFRDVLIDTVGACLGALIFLAIVRIHSRLQAKKYKINPVE